MPVQLHRAAPASSRGALWKAAGEEQGPRDPSSSTSAAGRPHQTTLLCSVPGFIPGADTGWPGGPTAPGAPQQLLLGGRKLRHGSVTADQARLTVSVCHAIVDDPHRLGAQLLRQEHVLKQAQAVGGPIAPHACGAGRGARRERRRGSGAEAAQVRACLEGHKRLRT